MIYHDISGWQKPEVIGCDYNPGTKHILKFINYFSICTYISELVSPIEKISVL